MRITLSRIFVLITWLAVISACINTTMIYQENTRLKEQIRYQESNQYLRLRLHSFTEKAVRERRVLLLSDTERSLLFGIFVCMARLKGAYRDVDYKDLFLIDEAQGLE